MVQGRREEEGRRTGGQDEYPVGGHVAQEDGPEVAAWTWRVLLHLVTWTAGWLMAAAVVAVAERPWATRHCCAARTKWCRCPAWRGGGRCPLRCVWAESTSSTMSCALRPDAVPLGHSRAWGTCDVVEGKPSPGQTMRVSSGLRRPDSEPGFSLMRVKSQHAGARRSTSMCTLACSTRHMYTA